MVTARFGGEQLSAASRGCGRDTGNQGHRGGGWLAGTHAPFCEEGMVEGTRMILPELEVGGYWLF